MDHDAITVIARRRVLSHRITANLTPSRARHRAMAPALGPAVARAVDDLAHDIRRGRYDAEAPATLAKRVAETLIQAVATASADATVDDVVASVRAVGGRLAVIKREHLLVGNVARRLLRVIRDEFQHDDDETPSAAGDGDDATTRTRRMKKDVIWSPDGPKRVPKTASWCFGKKLGQNGGPMGLIGRKGGFPYCTFPIRKVTFLCFSQTAPKNN